MIPLIPPFFYRACPVILSEEMPFILGNNSVLKSLRIIPGMEVHFADEIHPIAGKGILSLLVRCDKEHAYGPIHKTYTRIRDCPTI